MIKEKDCNTQMMQLLSQNCFSVPNKKETKRIEDEVNAFFRSVVEIQGCVIHMQKKKRNCEEDSLLEMHMDRTGFECVNNEMFFMVFDRRHLPHYINTLLCNIENSLTKRYPQRAFRIVVSLDSTLDSSIHAWFHLIREGEVYFDKDINNYNQPVLTEVIIT